MSGLATLYPELFTAVLGAVRYVPRRSFRSSRGGDESEWAPLLELAAYILACLVIGLVGCLRDRFRTRKDAKELPAEQRRLREARRVISQRVR